MAFALRSCALLLAVATAGHTADPAVQELFRQARRKVMDNASRLPRYTCVENIDRTQYKPAGASPSNCQSLIAMRKLAPARGSLLSRNRLRLDVAVVDGGEIFSWAGAGKFETHDVEQFTGSGASGSGEFGSFLISVFGNEPDVIRYMGLRNSFALFDYNVPLAKSSYRYRANGPTKTLGFHGSFLVDPADGDLQQLLVETDQFGPGDSACRVQHTMDYQRVKIGSGEFLLPEVSTMDVLYRDGSDSLNQTHYQDCREYVGESTIHFEDVDTTGGPAAAKAALQPLPPKTRLLVGLSTPIKTETAAAGDEVSGVVLRDAAGKQRETVARVNDRVHGRILRLEQYMDPEPRWFLAIRFDTIERNGVEQPISLKPLDDGERSGPPPRRNNRAQSLYDKPEGAGLFVFSEHGNMVLDQKFRSEWETR